MSLCLNIVHRLLIENIYVDFNRNMLNYLYHNNKAYISLSIL